MDSTAQLNGETFQTRLTALHNHPETAAARAADIYAALTRESRHVKEGNFSRIAPADLALLFDLYDARFYDGHLRREMTRQGTPLQFKLSRKMTSAGGKTYLIRQPSPDGPAAVHYQIAVSAPLLFGTFADVQRTVRVNGLVCQDRLEALQRVFEHETLHLAELLAWGDSSCSGRKFKTLAWRIFGHTDTAHDLVTQAERALTAFDLKVGDVVRFTHEGRRREGIVNRITQRATVLVEHPTGEPYNNGKCYLKFYVPLAALEKT